MNHLDAAESSRGFALSSTAKSFPAVQAQTPLTNMDENACLLRELENIKELSQLQEEEIKSLVDEKLSIVEGELGQNRRCTLPGIYFTPA